MIIRTDLVRASIARWSRETPLAPAAIAQKLGEGDRSAHATPKQRQQRMGALLAHARDPIVARTQLERIIDGNDLTGINYLAIGTLRSRSVCRVHLRDSTGRTVGFGSGFLVGPGVLMTNHHVISSADVARYALAEFDYEYDVDGSDKQIVTFPIVIDPPPIPNASLDFCLVAVGPRSLDGKRSIEEFGWLPLNGARGKAIVGEYLTIIQHPSGERKQVCVRENKLLRYDESAPTLWYNTDTTAGSSGSPVFNETWQVVALHHSGVPAKNAKGQWLTNDGKVWDASMDETQVKWVANEGIRISAIVAFLSTTARDSTLARAVTAPGVPPTRLPGTAEDKPADNGNSASEIVGDELRLTIPVRVSVRLGALGAPNGANGHIGTNGHVGTNGRPPALGTAPIKGLLPAPSDGDAGGGLEKVVVDQTNYNKRPGYDPNHLGKGKLAIPLPKIVKGKSSILVFGTKKSSVLDYWNYSLVMNKDRRLAFFSAINVDGDQRKGTRDKQGDTWYFDTRIPKEVQLGPAFYGQQKTFEAVNRTDNPFDRGHLSCRNDAQWGESEKEAKRNGDDSYHWTNCSPQHYLFNQGKKLWEGLEEYVITSFAKESDGRASVFNGPVFDAPVSSRRKGRIVPNVRGKPAADPTFGEIAIPKMFFKIVACVRNDELAVAAFLMSQEDLLSKIDRLKGMKKLPEEILTVAEAKLFQVSVADVAKLTGLDFGPLANADAIGEELLAGAGPNEVQGFDQVSF